MEATYLDERGYLRYKTSKELVHREVLKESTGPILPGWVVHHIDGNKLNNELKNLIALPSRLHSRIHANAKGNLLPTRKMIEPMLKWYKNLEELYRTIEQEIKATQRNLKFLKMKKATLKRSMRR